MRCWRFAWYRGRAHQMRQLKRSLTPSKPDILALVRAPLYAWMQRGKGLDYLPTLPAGRHETYWATRPRPRPLPARNPPAQAYTTKTLITRGMAGARRMYTNLQAYEWLCQVGPGQAGWTLGPSW